MFLIDSCCSYSVQMILAGSTTYCCFQITLFQYLEQNSVLWKIKLQTKLYKLGGKPQWVLCRKVLCFIQPSRLTFLLSHCHPMGRAAAQHSTGAADELMLSKTLWQGYSSPNRGSGCLWNNVQQLCLPAMLPIMIKYMNLDHHILNCLGFILYLPHKGNLFLVKFLFNIQCVKKLMKI